MKYNKIGSVPYTHMTSVSYPRTRYAINENRPSHRHKTNSDSSERQYIAKVGETVFT